MTWYRCIILTFLLVGTSASLTYAQADKGSWSFRHVLPTPRQEVPHVVLEDKIYVPGGFDATPQGSQVVEVYDPASDLWATVAPLPFPMHHMAAAAVNGQFYILGGYEGDSFAATGRVLAYDPGTDSWTEKAPMPTPRGAHAAVAFEGRIYVIGGRTSTAVATTEVYDSNTDSWESRAPMPTAREHLAAALIDSLIYVVGGRIFENRVYENQNTLEVYSPRTDTWRTLSAMPSRRGGLAAAEAQGKLYVFGGEGFDFGGEVYSNNEEYDPTTDTWRTMAPMPTPRHGLGAATVNDTIYLIGGGPVAGFSTSSVNSAFTPPPATPTILEAEKLPSQTILHPNFPNPFTSDTTLRFSLASASTVRLTIYDVWGREIQTLLEGPLNRGLHSVKWNAQGQAPGLYLCRFETPTYSKTAPLTLTH